MNFFIILQLNLFKKSNRNSNIIINSQKLRNFVISSENFFRKLTLLLFIRKFIFEYKNNIIFFFKKNFNLFCIFKIILRKLFKIILDMLTFFFIFSN